MSLPHQHFAYISDGPLNEIAPDAFAVSIPVGVRDTNVLLSDIAVLMRFPSYFGHNWNALSDCLRDLAWIPESKVVIRHYEMPEIPIDDLRQYVSVLDEAVRSWGERGAHRLVVQFPLETQSTITSLL